MLGRIARLHSEETCIAKGKVWLLKTAKVAWMVSKLRYCWPLRRSHKAPRALLLVSIGLWSRTTSIQRPVWRETVRQNIPACHC